MYLYRGIYIKTFKHEYSTIQTNYCFRFIFFFVFWKCLLNIYPYFSKFNFGRHIKYIYNIIQCKWHHNSVAGLLSDVTSNFNIFLYIKNSQMSKFYKKIQNKNWKKKWTYVIRPTPLIPLCFSLKIIIISISLHVIMFTCIMYI